MACSKTMGVLTGVVLALVFVNAPFFSAWAEIVTGEKPSPLDIGDTPWDPASLWYAPKVVYGTDDRMDVYQETLPQRLTWAASTCGLISNSRIIINGDGSYTLQPVAYMRGGKPACEGEPFGNQPTAPFCSGFMVGSDLIATAGHCVSSGDLSGFKIVFGFAMESATEARTEFTADEVYSGIEIVSSASSGNTDHAIIRVDRPITAPGARPFNIRREGTIGVGTPIGVIGHPAGLPLKLAFGPTTAVRSNTDPGFFVANLDTYVGNSGSPVINANTGQLEGILVRGDSDFLYTATCFYSNTNTDSAGRGEDCTKISNFKDLIPPVIGSRGIVLFGQASYGCGGTVELRLLDEDLTGTGTAFLLVETTSGDRETLSLTEKSGSPGEFQTTFTFSPAAPIMNNGAVEAGNGDTLTARYEDADTGTGTPETISTTAVLDCAPPVISNVNVSFVSSGQATIEFSTNEGALPLVSFGTSCGNLAASMDGPRATTHVINLNTLNPSTQYFFSIQATDDSGNTGMADNGGGCFTLTTLETVNYFTEQFTSTRPVDIQYSSMTLVPNGSNDYYFGCVQEVQSLPTDPAGGQTVTLGDDAFVEVPLADEKKLRIYNQVSGRFFIGSNGYITFSAGDTARRETISTHFGLTRISMLFTDLNPSIRGRVGWQQLNDRIAVTFENVPAYDSSGLYSLENSHTFQVEMFFEGTIRITWRELHSAAGIAGLSKGGGAPAGFISTNISDLPGCEPLDPNNGEPHSADQDGDRVIGLGELLRVVQLYNSPGYSCDAAGEDGYRPGPAGGTSCTPHDSDYAPRDWAIGLSELLRVIQMFNADGYTFDPYSEDGYRPKFDGWLLKD